jgi:hypothetical protein
VSTYVHPPHPDLVLANGFHWLLRYVNGESIAAIARSVKHNRITVQKYMRKAAATMVDAAQAKILDEVFPLVVDVYKAHLRQQLTNAADGKPVEMAVAERLLKSMYVFDSPLLKQDMTKDEGEPTETLAGFIMQRTRAQLTPPTPTPLTIEAEAHETQDAPTRYSPSRPRALPDKPEGD